MSEEYQTVERNRDEGSIGIGAMIVFIALILVAAVASTIIIKTAEELQQNAEATSDDTRKEISGKISILQVLVNSSGTTDVNSLVITAKVASGSTDVLVNNVEWLLTCGDDTVYGVVSGNLGTESSWGEAIGTAATPSHPDPNAMQLDGTRMAATDELAAGTPFKFEIDLSDTNVDNTGASEDTLDAADFATKVPVGCDCEAGAGQELELRVVVDGGGETLANLKIESITLGKSIM